MGNICAKKLFLKICTYVFSLYFPLVQINIHLLEEKYTLRNDSKKYTKHVKKRNNVGVNYVQFMMLT